MAKDVNPFITFCTNTLNIAIIGERCGEVFLNIVDSCGKTAMLLAKCINHDFTSSNACGIFVDCSIRKGNVDHCHRDASYLVLDGPVHECDA